MKPVQVNIAEAIIEAFWAPELRNFQEWKIEDTKTQGLEFQETWSAEAFSWIQRPLNGPSLKISKEYSVDCTKFDKLILAINSPSKSRVKIIADTDNGIIEQLSDEFTDFSEEIQLNLGNSKKINKIIIEIYSNEDGYQAGHFKWIMLQNSDLLKEYLEQYNNYDSEWTGYLKDENYDPEFKPTYNLIVDEEELKNLRNYHMVHEKLTGKSMYADYVEELKHAIPENMIHDYVIFWTDQRFARTRDYMKRLTLKGPLLASAGLILKDKSLLRLAARYAMSLAMCTNWNDSFITEFKAGYWEHRAFVKAVICYEISMVLDLAGEMFTDLGRDLILRRLGEEAIGGINYITWKHDYIFDNNQLVWFTYGRMLAYAVLEQHFNHVKPYTDIAYKELVENIDNIIFEDGAYGEGPNYYNCIGDNANFATYIYAKLRGLEFKDIVPEKIMKTADFVECLQSTVPSQDVIPVCDGEPRFKKPTLAYMAYLLPNSHWSTILHKSLNREEKIPSDILAFKFIREFDKKDIINRSFISLPEMGSVSSLRKLDDQWLKIFVFGNKANVDHAHEDKGSFVIEFCNETFAMDPGSGSYSSEVSNLVKQAYRHNTSVPYGNLEKRPQPERPNTKDIKVIANGDERSFNGKVDLSYTWREFFNEYTREYISPTPDELIIKEKYDLKKGEGIDFGWSTQLDVKAEEKQVVISGDKGEAVITIPEDVSVEITELRLFDENSIQKRISFKKSCKKGELVIKVLFRVY
ncbi:heparinase II/III family protein [Vallitalea guaymasensis]|uniref:heparinase II/III family protein n=1 Tax=Vallitalea guaymasensis TaxID=1185412 RepID=UPI002357F846|nr:heparinase II/III family protein [Vallitalea guaymasensis]